ncbi:MAG TPA: hypothetical protein VGD56_12785, partial [Gemmatirosa sp.]
NARLTPGATSTDPRRLTADPGAALLFTLPPQAVAEESVPDGAEEATFVANARVAGPSVIEVALSAGTELELTVEALLAALAAGTLVPTTAGGDVHTQLELPVGLFASLAAASGAGSGVTVVGASGPSTSPAGDVGLWQVGFGAPGGVQLQPVASAPDDPALTGTLALDGGDRTNIVAAAQGGAAATLGTLSLSTLGATFSAALRSDAFSWIHRAALGRDEDVLVVTAGVLYPTGHRVWSVKSSRRRLPDDGDGAAALRTTERIVVADPVRATRAHDFRFSAVELLARDVAVGGHASEYHRALPDLITPRQTQRADAQQRFDDAMAQVGQTIAGRATTAQQLADQYDDQTARDYLDTASRVADGDAAIRQANAEINAAQRGLDNLQRQLTALLGHLHPDDPGGDPNQDEIDALQQQISDQGAVVAQALTGLRNLQASLAQDRANLPALQAQVNAELAAIPATYEALLAAGDPSAVAARDARAEAVQLDQEIADAQNYVAQSAELPVAWVPADPSGAAIRWPTRLANEADDLHLAAPLIFVADYAQRGDPLYPDFATLTDRAVHAQLASMWAAPALMGAGFEVAGTAVDLVQDATQLAGDVFEVHNLAIVGDFAADGFAPHVTGVQIKLPSLRALLPGSDGLVSVVYAAVDAAPDVPLLIDQAINPHLEIDFTGRPDLSGGLAAPRFLADGLSRTLGPVVRDALPGVGVPPGVVPNLADIYKDATVLGLPLGALIRTAVDGALGDVPPVPYAPSITPVLDRGLPVGATMTWGGLPLKSDGIFVAGDGGSHLDLQVQATRDAHTTSCTVANFSLALPSGAPLVTLSFGSLTMTQAGDRAPDVAITGFSFALGDALRLVETLQQAVATFLDANDPGVVVRRIPDGISAGYAFALPAVQSGLFALRGIAGSVTVEVPFRKKPVIVDLRFASPDDPFTVSVFPFGGGGYFLARTGGTSLERLELSLDFGAFVALDLVVASGEVHAFGAVSLVVADGDVRVTASLRIGGSVSVLGLIAVSVELVLALTYDGHTNCVSGRATLVIEVHVLFLSKSVELDSGTWSFCGPRPAARLVAFSATDDTAVRAEWDAYLEAFA